MVGDFGKASDSKLTLKAKSPDSPPSLQIPLQSPTYPKTPESLFHSVG